MYVQSKLFYWLQPQSNNLSIYPIQAQCHTQGLSFPHARHHDVLTSPVSTPPKLNGLLGADVATVAATSCQVSFPPFAASPTQLTRPMPMPPCVSTPNTYVISFVPTTDSSSIKSIKPTIPACNVLRWGLLKLRELNRINRPSCR